MKQSSQSSTIPFYPQIHDTACGAACIQMILGLYGIKMEQADIFEYIKDSPLDNDFYACRNDLIVHFFLQRGIPCTMLTPKQPSNFIRFCLENGLQVILQHHRDHRTTYGHFAVVSHIEGDRLYLHDPYDNNGKCVKKRLSQFPNQHMKSLCHEKDDDLTASFPMIVVSNPSLNLRVANCVCAYCKSQTPVISLIAPHMQSILCLGEGQWQPM